MNICFTCSGNPSNHNMYCFSFSLFGLLQGNKVCESEQLVVGALQ